MGNQEGDPKPVYSGDGGWHKNLEKVERTRQQGLKPLVIHKSDGSPLVITGRVVRDTTEPPKKSP